MIINNKLDKPLNHYNKYKYILSFGLVIYLYFYINHNYTKPEFEIRKKPNILIPKSVYDVRLKHYIYWEQSRVARGFRKTFTYYNYDNESVYIILYRNFYTSLILMEIVL